MAVTQNIMLTIIVSFLVIQSGSTLALQAAAKKNVSGISQSIKMMPSIFERIMKANQKLVVNNHTGFRTNKDGFEMFEGDIIMTPDIRNKLTRMGIYPYVNHTKPPIRTSRPKRAAISNHNSRWMGYDGRPLIPYVLERSVSHASARRVIDAGIKHWTRHVPCLRFVRRTTQRDYISFYNGGGCFSSVGRVGGHQRVSIARSCEFLGTVVHEIGHALGFWHEQSRTDRDRFIKIYWNNIIPQYKFAFRVVSSTNSLGVPYDYNSVMHYNARAFGIGNRITITRKSGDSRLGNPRGLSPLDIKQARLLYCGSGGTRPPTTHPPATLPPTTFPPTGCKYSDNSNWCSYWASQGHCLRGSKYYSYVSSNCKKSCLCKPSIVCQDKNTQCSAWSSYGYCTDSKYKGYMDTYCKKSCGLCT